jgi:hypothetical protein
MKKKALATLLTPLLLLGCQRCSISEPGIGINVEQRNGQYELTLQHCPATGSSVLIAWIKIVPKGRPEDADSAVPECEIKWRGGSAQLLKDKWIYGQTTIAYTKRRCVPLARGKTYDVYVNDSGHQRFEVLSDGHVRVEKPICP